MARITLETTTGAAAKVAAALGSLGTPVAANISGAATVDLSTGHLQVLTLTANVTALAFTNPPVPGQVIELHFVQDATGSRILTPSNANLHFSGGAFVLSGVANHRDVIRLRYIGTGYYEVSRAMNVI